MRGVPAGLVLAAGALLLTGACGALWAASATEITQLKAAPGRDVTLDGCVKCHSVEYIPSNAPAMNRAVWQKTIQKMRERFGAPITDEQAQQILDYLAANYADKP